MKRWRLKKISKRFQLTEKRMHPTVFLSTCWCVVFRERNNKYFYIHPMISLSWVSFRTRLCTHETGKRWCWRRRLPSSSFEIWPCRILRDDGTIIEGGWTRDIFKYKKYIFLLLTKERVNCQLSSRGTRVMHNVNGLLWSDEINYTLGQLPSRKLRDAVPETTKRPQRWPRAAIYIASAF